MKMEMLKTLIAPRKLNISVWFDDSNDNNNDCHSVKRHHQTAHICSIVFMQKATINTELLIATETFRFTLYIEDDWTIFSI